MSDCDDLKLMKSRVKELERENLLLKKRLNYIGSIIDDHIHEISLEDDGEDDE